MDQRRQEYRELLSAITHAYMQLIRRFDFEGAVPPELVRVIEDAKAESFRVFRDRIFIAQELAWSDELGDWDTAVTNFERSPDPEGRIFRGPFYQAQ